MNLNLPNFLSVLRVLAAPCVAFAYAAFARPEADRIAVVIFVAAAITDYLDGILARYLEQESAFGRMLDPIADKAMVMIALAVLMALYRLDWVIVVPAALIILREVLVSGLREYLGEIKLPVTRIAKWKTTFQMVSIGFLLAAGAIGSVDAGADGPAMPATGGVSGVSGVFSAIGLVGLWIAAWFTLVTGGDYFFRGMAYIRRRRSGGGCGAERKDFRVAPLADPDD